MPTLTHEQKLDRLKFYRSEVNLEWNLLQGRLNSLLTSQAFLVSAYAISMGNSSPVMSVFLFTLIFPLIVSTVGLITSLRAYPGIDGAIRVIGVWRKKQYRLYLSNPDARPGEPDYMEFDPDMIDYQDIRELGKTPVHPTVWQAAELFFQRKSSAGTGHTSEEQVKGTDTIDDIHKRSLYFSRYAPKIFFYTWFLLALLTVTLHLFDLNKTTQSHQLKPSAIILDK